MGNFNSASLCIETGYEQVLPFLVVEISVTTATLEIIPGEGVGQAVQPVCAPVHYSLHLSQGRDTVILVWEWCREQQLLHSPVPTDNGVVQKVFPFLPQTGDPPFQGSTRSTALLVHFLPVSGRGRSSGAMPPACCPYWRMYREQWMAALPPHIFSLPVSRRRRNSRAMSPTTPPPAARPSLGNTQGKLLLDSSQAWKC